MNQQNKLADEIENAGVFMRTDGESCLAAYFREADRDLIVAALRAAGSAEPVAWRSHHPTDPEGYWSYHEFPIVPVEGEQQEELYVAPAPAEHERKMVAEISFDPTNHHNALKCPYCNPKGLTFAETAPAGSVRDVLVAALKIVGEPASGHRMMSSRREAMALYKLLQQAITALSAPEPHYVDQVKACDDRSTIEAKSQAPVEIVREEDYCTFGPPGERKRQWLMIFEDADRGICIYDNEAEAHEAWDRAKDSWTCTLYETCERKFFWAAGQLRTLSPAPLPQAAESVSEGWKLVPIKPDQGQIEEGCEDNPTVFSDETDANFAADVAHDVYVAMVRAAPTPPQAAEKAAETVVGSSDAKRDYAARVMGGDAARFRHKKRGTTYILVGECQVQAEEPLTDYEVAVVYRSEQDGTLWVRRRSEFRDGRFEEIAPAPAVAAADPVAEPKNLPDSWDYMKDTNSVRCGGCLFRFGAEHPDSDGNWTCPNCGDGNGEKEAAAEPTREEIANKRPIHVSNLARGLALDAFDDIRDEHPEAKTYYLARWFDALLALSKPRGGTAPAGLPTTAQGEQK